MPAAPPSPISSFHQLSGGVRGEIAPDGPQIVSLSHGSGATWWVSGQPVTVELPPGTPVDGTRWSPDGKSLHVGLGALDLAARTWNANPKLVAWSRPGPRGELQVKAAAWSEDTAHVALVRRPPSRDGSPTTPEIVVVKASDGRARARLAVAGASQLAVAGERVLVGAPKPVLLDLDAKVIAELPLRSVIRIRDGASMFAAVGATGAVVLVRPRDGAVIATWEPHAGAKVLDAVPVDGGVATIDVDGTVRLGCIKSGAIHEVAEAASGAKVPVIQRVGGQLVVAGSDINPVRVASFHNPCH